MERKRRMRWMNRFVMHLLSFVLASITTNRFCVCVSTLTFLATIYIRLDHRQIYGFRQAGLHRDHQRGQESVSLRRPVNFALLFFPLLLRQA